MTKKALPVPSLDTLKVGDSVVLASRAGADPRTRTVTKVGRRYLYIENYTNGFDLETGYDPNNSHVQVFTPEEFALEEEAKRCRKELAAVGVNLIEYTVSTEQAIAIRKALLDIYPKE